MTGWTATGNRLRHDNRRASLSARLGVLMADERVGEAAQALDESRMALGRDDRGVKAEQEAWL